MIVTDVLSTAKALWCERELPQWGDDSPTELFALFRKHVDGTITPRELDAYVRLLMHVVAISFHQARWCKKLPELGLDPRDVAQSLLTWAVRKTRNGMNLQHHEPLVLMAVLFTSFKRYVLSVVSDAKGRASREVTASSYNKHRGGKDDEGVELRAPAPLPPLVELADALENAEDFVIGSIVTTGQTYEAVEDLWYFLRSGMVEYRLVGYAEIPVEFHGTIDPEMHALVLSRLNRWVREYASEGAVSS